MAKTTTAPAGRPDLADVPYLDTPEAADRFLAAIADTRELALDTEGASFHRFVDRIYLLQLTAPEGSAIIDPLGAGALVGLGRLLEDPAVEIVFHDADYDLRLLHQDYGWHVRRIFDTRIAAQLLGIKAFGLAALLEREFGVRLDKKHQRADWSMRPLTADMLEYAAQDTKYLLELRDRLRDQLVKKGRLAWVEEEFERLEGTRWPAEDAELAFMRLKGARDLTRRELALLRELVKWRDAVAGELDRSTFRVVGNEALFEIARKAPRSREELSAIKGVPRGSLEHRAGEMLEAVRRGLAVPDAELPRFPRAPRWDRDPDFDTRVSLLRTVRDAAATRLELDPGVLCPRERLESVARRNPRTIEELLETVELRRWQASVLGEAMLTALREAPATPTTGGRAARMPTAETAAAETATAPPARGGTDDADRSPYLDA
jgi:ribonuclease D